MITPDDPRKRNALALLLVVLGVWVWFFPPGALLPDNTPMSPERQMENGLRMEMFKTASAVDTYLEESGELPESLEDAGRPRGNVRYQILSEETYRLEGRIKEIPPVSWISSEGVGVIIEPVLSTR